VEGWDNVTDFPKSTEKRLKKKKRESSRPLSSEKKGEKEKERDHPSQILFNSERSGKTTKKRRKKGNRLNLP